MTYLDSGFNQFFQRQLGSSLTGGSGSISQYDFESQYLGLSANQIKSGVLSSRDGNLSLDLDEGIFIVTDGAVERIRLGKTEDGSYGLIVRDESGNTILQFTGDVNIIKSPDNSLELNFDNTQIIVRSVAGLIKVLIGKDINGF
jgi:hypothetical protein